MQYQNPEDQYIKSVYFPKIWTFIFGPLYFLIHGNLQHVLGYLIVFISTVYFVPETEPGDWFVVFLLFHVIYALCARRIMHNYYMRKGWIPLNSGADGMIDAGMSAGLLSLLWRLIK